MVLPNIRKNEFWNKGKCKNRRIKPYNFKIEASSKFERINKTRVEIREYQILDLVNIEIRDKLELKLY